MQYWQNDLQSNQDLYINVLFCTRKSKYKKTREKNKFRLKIYIVIKHAPNYNYKWKVCLVFCFYKKCLHLSVNFVQNVGLVCYTVYSSKCPNYCTLYIGIIFWGQSKKCRKHSSINIFWTEYWHLILRMEKKGGVEINFQSRVIMIH